MDSEYRPFGNFWLDSAVQETLVPGKEWDKLQEKITDLLVQKLRSSLVDDVKRRAIFIVLGRKFCTLHFPQYPFEEVEMMNRNTASYSYGTLWEEKMRISQCETFICSQLAKCMEEVGCSPTVGLPPLTSSVSPELVNFRTKSHILFSRTIKNQLAIESVLKNSIPRGLQSGSKQDGTGKALLAEHDLLARVSQSPTQNNEMNSYITRPKTFTKFPSTKSKPKKLTLVGENETCQSLSSSLALIMKKDPERIPHISAKFLHCFIPQNLRLDLWKHNLFKLTQEKLNQVPVRTLKEQFIHAVQSKIPGEELTRVLKGGSPLENPEYSRMFQELEKSFQIVPVLRMFACNEWVENFTRIIRLCDAITPGMKASLVFPIYVTSTSQHQWTILDIAFMTQLVRMCGIPSDSLLDEICQNAVSYLEKWDFEFIQFLRKPKRSTVCPQSNSEFEENTKPNSMDQVCKNISQERRKTKSWENLFQTADLENQEQDTSDTLNLLADSVKPLSLESDRRIVEITNDDLQDALIKFKIPLEQERKLSPKTVFEYAEVETTKTLQEVIKNFVTGGFVDWLTIQPIMFLWDQLMIGFWKPKLIEQICVVILALIKHQITSGRFTEEVKLEETLENAGCKLFTKDIVKCLAHVRTGGSLNTMPVSRNSEPMQPTQVVTQYLYPDEDRLVEKLIPKLKESLLKDIAHADPVPLRVKNMEPVRLREKVQSPKAIQKPVTPPPVKKPEVVKPPEQPKIVKKLNVNKKKPKPVKLEKKHLNLEKIENFRMRKFKVILNLQKVPKKYKQLEANQTEVVPEEPKIDVFTEEIAPILKKFDGTRIKLEVMVCSGSKTILSDTFQGKAKVRKVLTNAEKGGRKEIEVDFMGHRPEFIFSKLGNKGLMSLEGEPPYMMLKLSYVDKQNNLFMLGNSKVEFWRKLGDDDVYCWYPPFGEVDKEVSPIRFQSKKPEHHEVKPAGNWYILDEKSLIYFFIYSKGDELGEAASPPSTPEPEQPILDKRFFWTPYNYMISKNEKTKVPNTEPFQIFIDQLRYLPDNIRVFRLACKIVGTGFDSKLPELKWQPELRSRARCPQFEAVSTQIINIDENLLELSSVLYIRVFTVDINTGRLSVLGNAAMNIYDDLNEGVNIKPGIPQPSTSSSVAENHGTDEEKPETKPGKLRIGGHQLRFHQETPKQKKSENVPTFSGKLIVPGTTLLLRIQHVSEDRDLDLEPEAPDYRSGFYQSASCEPSESETRLLSTFERSKEYPETVRESFEEQRQIIDPEMMASLDKIDEMTEEEEADEEGQEENKSEQNLDDVSLESLEDNDLLQWAEDRLKVVTAGDRRSGATTKNSRAANLLPFLPLKSIVNYDKQNGIKFNIIGAFALDAKEQYVNIYSFTISGKDELPSHLNEPETDQSDSKTGNLGEEYHFISNKHDYSALLSAPKWLDGPIPMNPDFTRNTKLIFVALGLDPNFQLEDTDEQGLLSNKDSEDPESEISFVDRSYLGWTAVDLYEGRSVNSAVHFLPLIEAPFPTLDQLEEIRTEPMQVWLNRHLSNKTLALQRVSSSLKVEMYDGCFTKEEGFTLEENFSLIDSKPHVEKRYRASINVKTGSKYSDKVLKFMKSKYQRKGPSGEKYERTKFHYENAMSDLFFKLVGQKFNQGTVRPEDGL